MARADQHRARRDEPGWPPTPADGVPAAIQRGAAPQARCASGDDGLGPGPRTERPGLAGAVRAGHLVRGPLVVLARRADPSDDALESDPAGGHQPAGAGDDRVLYREPTLTFALSGV